MKLSVIIAAYNVQDYIIRCLESLANQKMKDVEFLVVDDGSTDQTGKYIQDFINRENDDRFSYLKKENGGLSSARNFGQDRAKGEYIWYIDGDDYIENDSRLLERLYKNADESSLDVLIFNFKYDGSWGEKYSNNIGLSLEQECSTNGIYYMTNRKFNYSVWHYLFKRSIVCDNNIYFVDKSTAEDLGYTSQVLLKAKKVKYVPIVAYDYIYREGSITKSKNKDKIIKRIKDVICESEKVDSELKDKGIRNGNSLISGYIAQALMACATGYVPISRKAMRLFFKGKDLSIKEKIKVFILLYLPNNIRKKVCKKIIL